jgi:hypothetical protein
MYHIEMSVEIHAPVSRVWRALCDPTQVVRWDSGVTEALNAPEDYPLPGQHVRWLMRSGFFRLLHDWPAEVVPEQTLRSLLSLGPYEINETYSLSGTPTGTRLELLAEVGSVIPLMGRLLVHFHGGPQAQAGFEASLLGLRRYCEDDGRSR